MQTPSIYNFESLEIADGICNLYFIEIILELVKIEAITVGLKEIFRHLSTPSLSEIKKMNLPH